MNIKEVAAKYADYQIEMRRYFHKHPEVSGKEFETSKAVKAELDKMGIPYRDCGMGTGVLATIEGTKPGKTILLRADMDALTVHETTGAEYASVNEGVMHACGHDCHISMLLTAAHILMDMREDLCGTVRLAFQPAEEIALGAIAMIDEGAMDGVDGCFGIHVWTEVPAGTVSIGAPPLSVPKDTTAHPLWQDSREDRFSQNRGRSPPFGGFCSRRWTFHRRCFKKIFEMAEEESGENTISGGENGSLSRAS